MSALISFLSDFGLRDGYVAQVKARILSGLPGATIVDITHELPAYGIVSGAWLLADTYAWFPPGTLHLAIVDPGVGTARAVLAIEKDGHTFIGPDNGLFSFLYPAQRVMRITWRPAGPIAPTFHGRDILAPLAVEVLRGTPLDALGEPLTNPVCFDTAAPQVVHIDRYGNIVTNIAPEGVRGIGIQGREVSAQAATFDDIPEGIGLIRGSAGTIEIVARRRSAADLLGAWVGMSLTVMRAD